MKVTYLVVNGMVLQEDRDGVVREYRPDTNGNTVALTDATTATDTWEYWPYGELRTRTGTTATPFQFGGVLGYYTDSSSRLYVRARHYRPKVGRWQTVDPLWPGESAYGYGLGRPHQAVDPGGMLPSIGGYTVMPDPNWFVVPDPNWFRLLLDSLQDPKGTALRIARCRWPCADCAQRAREYADGVFGLWNEGGDATGSTRLNAISHCNSACEAARRCGASCAEWWLNQMYEGMDPIGRFQGTIGFDIHNNSIGIMLGVVSSMSCLEACVNAADGGRLLWVGPPPRPGPRPKPGPPPSEPPPRLDIPPPGSQVGPPGNPRYT